MSNAKKLSIEVLGTLERVNIPILCMANSPQLEVKG